MRPTRLYVLTRNPKTFRRPVRPTSDWNYQIHSLRAVNKRFLENTGAKPVGKEKCKTAPNRWARRGSDIQKLRTTEKDTDQDGSRVLQYVGWPLRANFDLSKANQANVDKERSMQSAQFRVTPKLQQFAAVEIDNNLKQDFNAPGKTEWESPIFFREKEGWTTLFLC